MPAAMTDVILSPSILVGGDSAGVGVSRDCAAAPSFAHAMDSACRREVCLFRMGARAIGDQHWGILLFSPGLSSIFGWAKLRIPIAGVGLAWLRDAAQNALAWSASLYWHS